MINLEDITIVIPGNRKDLIYSILDNIPAKCKRIVIDYDNSFTESVFSNINVEYVNNKNKESLQYIITKTIQNKIKTKNIILLQPNNLYISSDYIKKISSILDESNRIYIENNILNISVEDLNMLNNIYLDNDIPLYYSFGCMIFYLQYKHNFKVNGFINPISSQYQEFLNNYIERIKDNKIYTQEIFKNISIIVPTIKNKKLNADILTHKHIEDEVLYISSGKNVLAKSLQSMISEAKYDDIVILNPYLNSASYILDKFKRNYDGEILLSEEISEEASIIFNKKIYNILNISPIDNFKQLLSRIIKKEENIITEIKENIEINEVKEVSEIKYNKTDNIYYIIIPFMFNGDRWNIFNACIENLYNLTKHIDNIKICIHECSDKKYISKEFIEKYDITYIYTNFTGVFHRAWALNVAARYLSSQEKSIFVFMDGDLLITKEWVDELLCIDGCYVGWGELFYLNKEISERYIKSNDIKILNTLSKLDKMIKPDINEAAGGITIIPKDIFFKIKGFPEVFKGTWGGEDNAMLHKMKSFNFHFKEMSSKIYHLYHEHKTKKDQSIKDKWLYIKKWNKKDWIEQINKIDKEWGVGTKITISMINFMREHLLIDTLTNILNNTTMPINLILNVQNEENLNELLKKQIENLADQFYNNEIIWNKGNLGVGTPRYITTQKSLKNNSDYTIIIDSDMKINNGTLERLFNEIQYRDEYDIISSYCEPNFYKIKINNNKLEYKEISEGFVTSDAVGTGCLITKTEIFKNCNFQKDLFIGFIDIIWSLECKKYNKKIGILNDKKYKAFNDASQNSTKYNKIRYNFDEIKKSQRFLLNKYGISSTIFNNFNGYLSMINDKTLDKKVCVCTLNYMREEKLIKMLTKVKESTSLDLGLSLQIQNAEKINDNVKNRIELITNTYKNPKIIWSEGNVGASIPRYNIVENIINEDYDYILLIDSDMFMDKFTIERMLFEMDNRPEYGAIACWCKPNFNKWIITGNTFKTTGLYDDIFHDTDVMGTGCVIVRKEVFYNSKFCKEYFVGYEDLDWCMQVKKDGWKLGIVSDPLYKLDNDNLGDPQEYKNDRNNSEIIKQSRRLFMERWNLHVM